MNTKKIPGPFPKRLNFYVHMKVNIIYNSFIKGRYKVLWEEGRIGHIRRSGETTLTYRWRRDQRIGSVNNCTVSYKGPSNFEVTFSETSLKY